MSRPVLCLLLLLCPPLVTCKKSKPHIIFVWADDMGFGDVSWGEYPEIPTPNLKTLRDDGVELMNFYSQPKCTPSRAALMTAKYPYRYGAQTATVYHRTSNATLPYDLKLLPAYLKDVGYSTHMVGKWHLGFCSKRAIPTARGFDTFFGAWSNTVDYWQHGYPDGYDWTLNDTPYLPARGTYNTHVITNHTQHLLTQHFTNDDTKDKPVFLYVSYLAPHKPTQAPEEYKNLPECVKLKSRDDKPRQTYCGMVAAVDEGVGNITQTLKDLGKLDDFIIIFSSDNGAAHNAGASAYPLRGHKQTVYEGGTRVRTVIHAPKYLKKTPKEYTGLIHVTDVLPTLYEAGGGKTTNLPDDLDGQSFWTPLRKGRDTKREWMVYNMDSSRDLIAVRYKHYKLIYHDIDRVEGYHLMRGDPDVLSNLQLRYKSPPSRYRMFDLSQNPNEYEPSDEYPDAALQYPKMLKKLKKKMKKLWKEEVPKPVWVDIPGDSPYRPKNNDGAYGIGDCD